MTKKGTMRKYSIAEIEDLVRQGKDETKPAATPGPAVGAEFWRRAKLVTPRDRKDSVHLRVDADVLEWFKAQGKGHLTRMNAVLRSYYEANQDGPGKPKAPPRAAQRG